MNFHDRKQARREEYFTYAFCWKKVRCTACNGSGIYDHNGSPPCGACNGTGKDEEMPNLIKERLFFHSRLYGELRRIDKLKELKKELTDMTDNEPLSFVHKKILESLKTRIIDKRNKIGTFNDVLKGINEASE